MTSGMDSFTLTFAHDGDVNDDSKVDVADIASIVSYMSGYTTILKEKADVNGDGVVDVADIAQVISIMADTVLTRQDTNCPDQ